MAHEIYGAQEKGKEVNSKQTGEEPKFGGGGGLRTTLFAFLMNFLNYETIAPNVLEEAKIFMGSLVI